MSCWKKQLEDVGIDSSKDEFTIADMKSAFEANAQNLQKASSDDLNPVSNNQKMVEAVAYALPGPIYWINSDMTYIGVNCKAPCPDGLNHSDLIGTKVGNLQTDEFLVPVLSEFFKSDNESYSWDARILVLEKPKWFHFTVSKYAHGEAAVVFGFDVSARRELALKLRKSEKMAKSAFESLNNANTRLCYAQKMEALGEMADAIAHEINNPLAIINGRASLMSEYLDQEEIDESRLKEFTVSICATAQRISDITSSLKTFARSSEIDEIGIYSVKKILNQAIESCEISGNIKLSVKAKPECEFLSECRPKQIEEAFINFIRNSVQAVTGLGESWIKIEFFETEFDNHIDITDSGRGIARVTALKMFQPFFTTRDIGQGTGLGLSVSKGIVDDHGGTIGLDFSCPNTKFKITLPKAKTEKLAS